MGMHLLREQAHLFSFGKPHHPNAKSHKLSILTVGAWKDVPSMATICLCFQKEKN